MHIVYVTGMFADQDGDVLTGMPNYIYKIAKYMKSKGHNTSILTTGKKNKQWNYDGIRVYSVRVPYKKILSSEFNTYLLYPIMREFMFNHMLEMIDKNYPITLVQYAGWYGVGMLYGKKFPSILRISTYTKVQLYSKHTAKELAYITFTERMAAKRFDAVISPSHTLGDRFSNDVKRKVMVMPTPFYYPNSDDEDNCIFNEVLQSKKYFLFFGRVSPDKGIETIARCLEKILLKYPDYYFCFAGEIAVINGINMISLLKKSARKEKSRVIYLGELHHRQLNPIIRNAECILLPSLMDNFPNTALEAMWLNGIVIGTKGASFEEIIEDKVSGLLMEIDDSQDLMKKLADVMGMSDRRKMQMRENAKKSLQKYEAKTAGRKLEKYYKYVLEKRTRKTLKG